MPFTQTFNGRWVTGPETAPLGAGSTRVRAASGEAFVRELGDYSGPYPTYPSLASLVLTYSTYGSTPAGVLLFTDGAQGSQSLFTVPSAATGWQQYDAIAGTWQWDCDGDGSADGSGSIDTFLTDCNSTAKATMFGFEALSGFGYVDAVELGALGDTTVYNMEPPTMKIADTVKSETDVAQSVMTFKVTVSGPNEEPMKVSFATANGTAIAGKDYVAKKGVLTIVPGKRSGLIKITILGDARHEPNETFKVKLSSPTNAVVVDAVATGTIKNDD
jgi:hypothetical protein